MIGFMRQALVILTLAILPVMHPALDLTANASIGLQTSEAAVALAAADLARDLSWVLGSVPGTAGDPAAATLRIAIDPAVGAAESWQVRIGAQHIDIRGADALGAVYGIYAFSHRALDVDPLCCWSGRRPQARPVVPLAAGVWNGSPARFRWRGLFINDEDLLGRWRAPAGERFLAWPGREDPKLPGYHRALLGYYGPIIAPETMDLIYETVLRLGGNLIVPASFTDILEPAEAKAVRRAVERGLWVSQHHVEPLGVSFFAYETFWAKQGVAATFSYPSQRERFRCAWEAHARRWREIAGDRVIWQLGLRGKGDRAVWEDPAFDRSRAGALISDALEQQVAIIRAIDPRPAPPMTLTLWLEMAELVAKDQLRIPEGVVLVAADGYTTPGEAMNAAFMSGRMLPQPRGCYLHAAVWAQGPHLVQGVCHRRLHDLIGEIAARGDTAYALINGANVREHILALATAFAALQSEVTPWGPSHHLPREAAALVERLIAVQLRDGRRWTDGFVRTRWLAGKPRGSTAIAGQLRDAIAEIEAIRRQVPHLRLDPQDRAWMEHLVIRQGGILSQLYRAAAARMRDDQVAEGIAYDDLLAILAGDPDWYRGEQKLGIRKLRSEKP